MTEWSKAPDLKYNSATFLSVVYGKEINKASSIREIVISSGHTHYFMSMAGLLISHLHWWSLTCTRLYFIITCHPS